MIHFWGCTFPSKPPRSYPTSSTHPWLFGLFLRSLFPRTMLDTHCTCIDKRIMARDAEDAARTRSPWCSMRHGRCMLHDASAKTQDAQLIMRDWRRMNLAKTQHVFACSFNALYILLIDCMSRFINDVLLLFNCNFLLFMALVGSLMAIIAELKALIC